MAMTRKHVVMIADIVNRRGGDNREALAKEFAAELRAENSAFDRQRFLDACTADANTDDDVITVHGYEQLTNSAEGCPRFKLFANGGALLTSSGASCNYGITNGWTVNHVTKTQRQARVTRTRAGRIETLTWLDGDN